jgi:hypothetical protein
MSEAEKIAPPTPSALSAEDAALLDAVYEGNSAAVRRRLIADGADVNARHPETGLTALQLAVGTNNYPLSVYLIEKCGARFGSDRLGRWPTSLAARCRASVNLCDYIVEEEAAAMTDGRRQLLSN